MWVLPSNLINHYNMEMKILILCTGNSCRSQMAQAFLQCLDDRLTVCSAGTRPAHRVNPDAVRVMREKGIDLSANIPESVDTYLSQPWDYVITVCGGARDTCPTFSGTVRHRLHIGFDDPSDVVGTPEFVDQEFHRVRDEICRGMTDFYETELKPRLSQEA